MKKSQKNYLSELLRKDSHFFLHIHHFVRYFANNEQKKKMNKDYSIDQEQLARFAKAMGHPARIAILDFLAQQNCCFFGDIHEVLPIAKATVSQHLKELKDAGLIQGSIEPPKVKYCINKENWAIAQKLFTAIFKQINLEKENCCN